MEPPYIVSIVLVVLLNSFSHAITGKHVEIDYLNLAAHLAYLNNFDLSSYANVVYWTLGIEFQFYVLIAFLFPLLRASKKVLGVVLAFFLMSALIPFPHTVAVIFPFLPYFGLGILVFFFKKQVVEKAEFLVAAGIFLLFIFMNRGPQGTIGVAGILLLLLFWQYSNRLIKFFSMISFSLYLIHIPVRGKVINLGLRFVESVSARYLLLAAAIVISICAAFLFYQFVERPSLRSAKKIRYKLSEKSEETEVQKSSPYEPRILITKAYHVQE